MLLPWKVPPKLECVYAKVLVENLVIECIVYGLACDVKGHELSMGTRLEESSPNDTFIGVPLHLPASLPIVALCFEDFTPQQLFFCFANKNSGIDCAPE